MKLHITFWVDPTNFHKFRKDWKQLMGSRTYYSNHKFLPKGVPTYTTPKTSCMQFSAKIADYEFWIEKTIE